MNSLLSIIPLAAVDSVNVLALLAIAYVWLSSGSRTAYVRTAAAFVIGGVCGLTLTLAFSFTVILRLVHRALDSFPRPLVTTIVLVIALAVMAMAVQGFRKPPMSLPVHRTVRPAAAYVIGLATWGIQSLTSAPFYAAIAVMADDDTTTRLALSTVFVLVALLPVTTLTVALALCPEETGRRLLDRVQAVLPIASRVVSVLLGVGAAAVAAIAIADLPG